mmetsp:Transcript_22413/g.32679  ORF Transcript_22413/g.32679 Transcript_22413/m.32679 type:complete len:233 (-) Transcript_22413:19-717(-)
MSIKFDNNGNIDAASLEKELQNALDFDLKYKQTDGMKKRAIKTAQSYDEFKNMVACAHLKTVSREEVESLRAVKKGWKKAKEKKPDTLVLEKEVIADTNKQVDASAIQPRKIKKPKTSMDFERDWRRLKSIPEKKRFLVNIGAEHARKIFKGDISAETMEEMISVMLQDGDSDTSTDAEQIDVFSWLQTFSELPRFSLTVRFLDAANLNKVVAWLNECSHPEAQDVAARFTV